MYVNMTIRCIYIVTVNGEWVLWMSSMYIQDEFNLCGHCRMRPMNLATVHERWVHEYDHCTRRMRPVYSATAHVRWGAWIWPLYMVDKVHIFGHCTWRIKPIYVATVHYSVVNTLSMKDDIHECGHWTWWMSFMILKTVYAWRGP